jgi:integrase
MTAKITKTLVDASEPTDKVVFVWDLEIKGFGLRVMPSGVKSFVFQYRTPEGRTRRATIGKYSGMLTADQARKKAKKLFGQVSDGKDPLEEKQQAKNSLTVNQVLDSYLQSAKYAEKAESTKSVDLSRINRHLRPLLGSKFVDKLTKERVRRAFNDIRDGKTAIDEKTGPRGRAIVKGGAGTARKAIRLLRAILNWAQSEGLIKTNPAIGINIGSDGERDIIIETIEQYAKLFKTLQRLEDEHRLRSPVADAIRLIALTGARRGEITGLCWKHMDIKEGIIKLPPTSHKTGQKTGKARIIGLPQAAQLIIAAQPKGEPDAYVFPPTKGAGTISLTKPWRLVRSEAGLPDELGLHGLRHSLASHMAMQGAQAAEIMSALGHKQLSTSQKYIHWAQNKYASLAEKAAAHITTALNDNANAGNAKENNEDTIA